MNLPTPKQLSSLSPTDIALVLNRTRTVTEAAKTLKVSRQALYKYMQKHIGRHCVYFAAGKRDFVAKIIMPPISNAEGDRQ
jgi:ACT domain-containing protein